MEDSSPKYTLEDAISSVGFGKFQGLALAYAGIGWTSNSMEVLLLSFIGPAVQSDWKLSPGEESFLSTAIFCGMLVGSYFWGFISDSFGRRRSILGSLMVTVATGLFSAFSPNYMSLVILRCLLGFGLGGGQIFALWFLEFIPTQNRGKWMMFYAGFWTVGSITEASLGWIIMPRLGWRWLIGFSALPSLAILLSSVFIPESPRYLCVKGKTMEAQGILMKVAEMNKTVLPPGILISDQSAPSESERSPLLSSSEERKTHNILNNLSSVLTLFSSELIRITLPLWFLYFGNLFLYYGVILITSKLSSGEGALVGVQTKGMNLYFSVFLTSLAEIPGITFAATMVDKIGRKIVMEITIVLVSIVLLPLISPPNETVTTALLFGARMFLQTTFSVVSTYAREVYPTSVRSVGVGMANAMGRIGGMISPFVAVGLVGDSHQTKVAIILFEVVTVFLGFTVLLFPFDTKGRKLTDTMLDHQQNSK